MLTPHTAGLVVDPCCSSYRARQGLPQDTAPTTRDAKLFAVLSILHATALMGELVASTAEVIHSRFAHVPLPSSPCRPSNRVLLFVKGLGDVAGLLGHRPSFTVLVSSALVHHVGTRRDWVCKHLHGALFLVESESLSAWMRETRGSQALESWVGMTV